MISGGILRKTTEENVPFFIVGNATHVMKHADGVFSGSLAKRKTTRYYVPQTPSLSLPHPFRPQARYRFSKFSGCFFLRSKLPSRLLFFLPVFPILPSFFPGYAIIAQPAEHSSAGNDDANRQRNSLCLLIAIYTLGLPESCVRIYDIIFAT